MAQRLIPEEAEDSDNTEGEDEKDDSQGPSDWSQGLDENELPGNAELENQDKAWVELQQVLNNIRFSRESPGTDYDPGHPARQDQIIFVSPEDLYLNKDIPLDYSPELLPLEQDLPDLPLYNFPPPDH